jgi:dTDP-glucose pyrophosphorylase
MNDVWKRAILRPSASVRDAIRNLNDVAIQIVLVTDGEGRLAGTLCDGDIRRGLLKGLHLDSPIESVLFRSPMVVPSSMSREMVMQLMAANKIHQVPIVDESRRVLGLHLWDEIVAPVARENTMVIMAGGKGTRLRPHTETCPKPMLPVAGKPMLEHILERAKAEGFTRFVLAVHYLGHMIEDYFGDGSKFGVHIDYLHEDKPLGTAGALSLLSPRPELPFVVTNGDVMTDIRYGELLDFHQRHGATATMAVRLHEWQHPFGVVRMDGVDIVGFEEKPVARTHINAGVYALSPQALDCMQVNDVCDMPSLFDRMQSRGTRTVAYPMHEPWLDVGRPDDLKLANQRVEQSESGA